MTHPEPQTAPPPAPTDPTAAQPAEPVAPTTELAARPPAPAPEMDTVRRPGGFGLMPRTLEDAWRFAKMIAGSDLAPKDYRDKPENVLVAMQMGAEIGIAPMQAVQNIAVINGKPSIYGDLGKALLRAAGFDIEETDIEVIRKTGIARCRITHPKQAPVERTYALKDAQTAGLWGKAGPWTTNPYRQMAWRAFWFAARDAAPHVLKGLVGAEEAVDLPPRPPTATRRDVVVADPPALPAPTPAEAAPRPEPASDAEVVPPASRATAAPELPRQAPPGEAAAADAPAEERADPAEGLDPDKFERWIGEAESLNEITGLRVELDASDLPGDITRMLHRKLNERREAIAEKVAAKK